MMAMMTGHQALETEIDQDIQLTKRIHCKQVQLAHIFQEDEPACGNVDAIHTEAKYQTVISLRTFVQSRSGVRDTLSYAKWSFGTEILCTLSV